MEMVIKVKYIFFTLALVLCCGTALAQESLAVSVTDTAEVQGTGGAKDTAVVRKKPAGWDAGGYVGRSRRRVEPRTRFVHDIFKDNLSIGFLGVTRIPVSSDYGFANGAGVFVQKWVSPSVGVRADVQGGYMYSNLTGEHVPEMSLGASVLFNVSSYVAGYDKGRFCEFSAVMGVGYSCRWDLRTQHYFLGNVGVNMNMKVSERFSVYLEPYLPLHVAESGMRYGFAVQAGAHWDLSDEVYKPNCADRYFLSLSGGVQLQNSALVKMYGTNRTVGMQYTLGAGRRFNNYFALKLTGMYSRHNWTIYEWSDLRMPANYFAFRMECILDILRLAMGKQEGLSGRFGCGIVVGPEAGFMIKKDLNEELKRHYVGLTGGVHADCRLCGRVSLFVEPRFTVIPYTAPNDQSTANNVNRNYYDAILNFNVGLDVSIGK